MRHIVDTSLCMAWLIAIISIQFPGKAFNFLYKFYSEISIYNNEIES